MIPRMRMVWPALLAAVLALLAACEPGDDQPYVAFDGGGFVFNYRVAEAYYGFNVRPMRQLAVGTVIEAEFEDPAGGAPIVERQTVQGERLRYSFRTRGLQGIKAGKPYRVNVHVLAAIGGKRLASYQHSFKSDLDQSDLPDVPPVLGPGFQLNPEYELPKKL